MFKDINSRLDTEKSEKQEIDEVQKKAVIKSIEMISTFFPDIIDALADKGYKASYKAKESLHGKAIEIEGQKNLGLFYYMDPTRKAVAVELNNGTTKNRHDFLYAPSEQEKCLQHYGEDVPIEVLLRENYEALLKKLEK